MAKSCAATTRTGRNTFGENSLQMSDLSSVGNSNDRLTVGDSPSPCANQRQTSKSGAAENEKVGTRCLCHLPLANERSHGQVVQHGVILGGPQIQVQQVLQRLRFLAGRHT